MVHLIDSNPPLLLRDACGTVLLSRSGNSVDSLISAEQRTNTLVVYDRGCKWVPE